MAVSDTPWSNFTPADFSSQQWARACVIDTENGDKDSRDRYKLAVREPSGVVNRSAVHQAVQHFNQVEGVTPDKRFVAARKLVTLYRTELAETPPDSLLSIANTMGEQRSVHDIERLFTNSWQGNKDGSAVEVRSNPNSNGGKKSKLIGGYAALFDKRSLPLGGFIEVVERSFFNKSKADNWPGVVCRYDHDNRMLLGTTASGTLRLHPDDTGLDYVVDLPECRGDVYEMVDRRDVRNSSFAFQVYEDEFTHDEGFPVRHLVSGRLIDVAPVTIPAYPDATVGLRSLATAVGAPIEDVVKLSETNELSKLFTRTDNNGKAAPIKGKSGRQAQLELLAMRPQDPFGEKQ
jgi:HK97 family phage prohead protease